MLRDQGTESHYYRAIGSTEALMAKAADLGQRWMKGVSSLTFNRSPVFWRLVVSGIRKWAGLRAGNAHGQL